MVITCLSGFTSAAHIAFGSQNHIVQAQPEVNQDFVLATFKI
jgi:hypothetical protein